MTQIQSKDTQIAYLERGQNLWKRAAHNLNLASDRLNPLLFIDWLETLLPDLKPATRRQYLAAIRALLNHLSKQDIPDIKGAIDRAEQMRSMNYNDQRSTKRRKRNTSSQKSKTIKFSEIIDLFKKTAHLKAKWVNPGLMWLAANYFVGLRPIEWRTASLIEEDSKITLVVINAKNTNGRSHGLKRHLDISNLKEPELTIIKEHLKYISNNINDMVSWNSYYEGVRHTINRITRKYLPTQSKYPTLYTTRHQFIANAKSKGMKKNEIAALAGHAVDETATTHYGKTKHGSGRCAVKPDPKEVARIRIKVKNESYTPK